ncbi:hypothetical protein AAMO2058_000315100 [Amorphochlora amoebiformis]
MCRRTFRRCSTFDRYELERRVFSSAEGSIVPMGLQALRLPITPLRQGEIGVLTSAVNSQKGITWGDVVEIFSESHRKWVPTIIRQVIPNKEADGSGKVNDVLVTKNKTVRRGDQNVKLASESTKQKYFAKKNRRQAGKRRRRMSNINRSPRLIKGALAGRETSGGYNLGRKPLKITVLGNTGTLLKGQAEQWLGMGENENGMDMDETKEFDYSKLETGQGVLYRIGTSSDQWVHASVVSINTDGSVNLDVCQEVPRELICSYPPPTDIHGDIKKHISSLEAECQESQRTNQELKHTNTQLIIKYSRTIEKLGREVHNATMEQKHLLQRRIQEEKKEHKTSREKLDCTRNRIEELKKELHDVKQLAEKPPSAQPPGKTRSESQSSDHTRQSLVFSSPHPTPLRFRRRSSLHSAGVSSPRSSSGHHNADPPSQRSHQGIPSLNSFPRDGHTSGSPRALSRRNNTHMWRWILGIAAGAVGLMCAVSYFGDRSRSRSNVGSLSFGGREGLVVVISIPPEMASLASLAMLTSRRY